VQTILMVESANIQRFPEFRKQVIDGSFMRFTCTVCNGAFVIETDLLYTDVDQGLFVGVFPRDRRADVAECEALVERTYDQVFVQEPPAFARALFANLQCRVVFGYEELREKVVCFAAGLDDHIIEAVKVALIDATPELGARLSLQQADDNDLWFARVGVSAPPFAVHRQVYDAMYNDRQQIQAMLQPLWRGPHVSADKCLSA
jgi:hypothetical protein